MFNRRNKFLCRFYFARYVRKNIKQHKYPQYNHKYEKFKVAKAYPSMVAMICYVRGAIEEI